MPWKERGTFRHTNPQDSISQERYICLHTAEVEAEVFFDIQADRLPEEKVETLA